MVKTILAGVVVLALSGCSAASLATAPTPSHTARLIASNLVIGTCLDVRCAYTVTVANTGPDCAEHVSATLTYGGQIHATSTELAGTVLRPGQSVTVLGTELPPNAAGVTLIGGGHAIACQ